jgi:CheY-like chemotaxis protein
VLLNLGNNAVKFTDRGEARLVVRKVTDEKGVERVEFTMHDTGIGISADSLRRLFVPFSQIVDNRLHRGGGTGLGLVISQKLVNLMGGEIVVTSELNRGSTFRFCLELPVAAMPTSNNSTTTTQALKLDTLSVLVAEDNPVNQMIIEAMLKQLGHTVTVAGNGRRTLQLLAERPFDLVLMDCNMPELDGLEATRLLRDGAAGARAAEVPVIALTANAMDGDRETCLQAGMNDFLSKPVSIAALRGAIDRLKPEPYRVARRA